MEDLPKLFTMLEQVETAPLMDTAIPRPPPYRWVRWSAGIAGLIVALGGAVFLVRRRLRAQNA
jgi:hypothetical protein